MYRSVGLEREGVAICTVQYDRVEVFVLSRSMCRCGQYNKVQQSKYRYSRDMTHRTMQFFYMHMVYIQTDTLYAVFSAAQRTRGQDKTLPPTEDTTDQDSLMQNVDALRCLVVNPTVLKTLCST